MRKFYHELSLRLFTTAAFKQAPSQKSFHRVRVAPWASRAGDTVYMIIDYTSSSPAYVQNLTELSMAINRLIGDQVSDTFRDKVSPTIYPRGMP
jgi:hypothetical protein